MKKAWIALALFLVGCDSQAQLFSSRPGTPFAVNATESVVDLGANSLMTFVFQSNQVPHLILQGTNREVDFSGHPAALSAGNTPGTLQANLPTGVAPPQSDSAGYVWLIFQCDQGSAMAKVTLTIAPPFNLSSL